MLELRILVVEDNNIQRMAILEMLKRTNVFCCVWDVDNGEDALHMLQTQPFDLLLTDIRMPHIDGIALVERVFTLQPSIRVVFITAYSEFEYAQKGIALGVSEYLLKPIDPKLLAHVVKKQAEEIRRFRMKNDCERYLAGHMVWKALQDKLSEAETEILERIFQGKTYCMLLAELQKPYFSELQREWLDRTAVMYPASLCLTLNEFQMAVVFFEDASAMETYADTLQAQDEEIEIVCLNGLRTLGELSEVRTALNKMGKNASQITSFKTEKKPTSLRMQDVLVYIDDHFADPLCQMQLAERLHITPSYFCTLFKREMNCSYVQYITKLRIRSAKRLLKDPSLRISEIAERVGYPSAAYFSALFHSIEGISPSKYRTQAED